VVTAVQARGPSFAEVVALGAEITWKKAVANVVHVTPDYAALVQLHRPVGFALRIGPYHGSGALADDAHAVRQLTGVAQELIATARKNGLSPVELQIDYDCATARLGDYTRWLAQVQRQLAPLPVTITALPAWLDSPAFAPLAARASNYVLQVHSLVKPERLDRPFTLCDPQVAQTAVDQAARLGVPFRVALPTYSYLVAFGPDGRFVGLAAETGMVNWPAKAEIREMTADPVALGRLVRQWSAARPDTLRGVIWYRLPVDVDNLNWRWRTLSAIVGGKVPQRHGFAEIHPAANGSVEVWLVNDGEVDVHGPLTVTARWKSARLVAGDGLGGFEMNESDARVATFNRPDPVFRLRAGERQSVGWLRLDGTNILQQLDLKTDELEKN